MYANDGITVDIACSSRRQTKMCSLSDLVTQPVIYILIIIIMIEQFIRRRNMYRAPYNQFTR